MTVDRKAVLAACAGRLKAIGLKGRRGGVFTEPVHDSDVLLWVALDALTYSLPAELLVLVYCGVHHPHLEQTLAQLRGEPHKPYEMPTISMNIGYQMPNSLYREWSFEDGQPLDAPADELAEAVATHGRAFAKENANLPAIIKTLQTSRAIAGTHAAYVVPAALALNGQKDEAVRALAAHLDTLGKPRMQLHPEHYSAFAARLESLLASS